MASQSEKAAISFLLKQFKDFEPAFKQSQGLCLKHLLWAFELAQGKKMLSRLAEVEKETLTKILEDLRSFARKSDYRYHSELTDQERSAWLRAVSKLTGRRGSE